jgi:LysM repeat protein/GH25 family lysozyme M1 (1,4-beta-N-acetylmuramidase)
MALFGIDISGWQAGLDPAAMQADFVIIKATGGTGYTNPTCDAKYQAAVRAGKKVGVYHFAHEAGFQGTAVAEATHFLASVKGYLNGHTLLVLDWEGDNWRDTGWAKTWLDTVFAATGVRPLIYLNGAYLHGADWSAVQAGNYGLWYAQYAVTSTTEGYTAWDAPSGSWKRADQAHCPATWGTTGPVMWQFADNAHIPGFAAGLDADVFYGDAGTWDAYCAPVGSPKPQGGVTPPPAPAPAPAPKPAPAPAPAPTGGPTRWIVDPGNTMAWIAGQVGVSLASLIAANPGVNPNLIYPGQTLRLPAGAHWPGAVVPAPKPAGPSVWIVDPGNTMSYIAAKSGVSLAALIAANPGVNPNLIHPGQVLHLPAGAHW